MVYSLPGVEVSCNKPTRVKIFLGGDERRHIFHWEFTVKFGISEVGKLREIDLLHRYHDCYRLTKIIGFLNNVEIFSEVPKERWSYSLPSCSWNDKKEGQMKVVVFVSFETTASNQTFTQCLRFDFGKKPFLLKGLNVDVASEEALDTLSALRQELKLHSSVWREGSTDIVPWPETADMGSQDLLKEYKLPERIENVVSAQIIDGNMTVDNYKRVMHQLLFTEELFMKKAISSFVLQNVRLDCQQSISDDWSGAVYAGIGELFGIVQFHENESLQPDDAAGRLLIRKVNSAWIKMARSSSQKAYEALLQKVENECVALKLSSQMCADLNVSDGGQIYVDVQFQLNRKPLCDWHAAIDRLGPIQLCLLFPTPDAPQIKHEERRPWNWLPLDCKLNTNQREVIKRILSPGDTSSPLVVFGPFGTGKTFTLNQAIRHLVTKKHNRILLCTQTNSAADIHVTLLHDYLTEEKGLKATRPLRIYQTNRRLNTDPEVAKMYGLIANNAYVLPTRDDVIRHRVVITTLAMSKHLIELQLNHGFFTHILVDEAAQALEPEALIPLALAGPNTKVVFTGDHMQMGPEVYSHYARDWGLQRSLPERLFDHYCEKKESDGSLIFLTENYRSHPDILQFPSDNFYGKELIARSEQASHPRLGPLSFFSVHGVEEARENSYINAAEVEEIVKRVELLAGDWPREWKEDLSQIGVISAYMTQIRAIRKQLRDKGLENVTVETIHNVQGKEFRALFISTVRTSLTCHSFDRRQSESQSLYWEFLSDPKLLNTAITRAMSLVAVVGDPVSLCTAGYCRGNWRDYIRRCHEHGALHGASYEEIKKKIDAPLAKIALNPEANEFVPQSMYVSSKELKSLELASQREISDSQISSSDEKGDLEVDKYDKRAASEIQDKRNIPTETNGSGIERGDEEDVTQGEPMAEEEEQEYEATQFSSDSPKNEFNSVRSEISGDQHQVDLAFQEDPQRKIQSQEEEDDVEQSASDSFEEFLRESFEDETVFPRCFDNIIKAFVDKCKATKEKEAQLNVSPENAAAFPSLHTAAKLSNKKSKNGKLSGKQASQEKSSSFLYSSEDYEICLVNGRAVVRLVNLGFHQTPAVQHQKLLTASTRQEDFLETQLLQQLLEEKPKKYVPCTLRLNSESTRTAYAEVSDTKTPDIKIRGRVRGAFDMDHVVVEKTDYQPSPCDGVPPYQGIIAGVLHHIIRPHERHYVCKMDYENPRVMIPINKSVSKIVYLTDKKLKGLPLLNIYKEIHLGSETPFKVDEFDFTEALSGKFLFLVQYLQWRSDCPYPLGIVIKKLPQGDTLSGSMRILFAEHGVRDRFSKESKAEVQTKFPPEWLIPAEEYGIRQKINGAFTIDPDNSKDLDDALTVEQLPDSVNRVGVHIADVSYFVEPGTQLDKDAMFRCRSYYPGHGYRSVPMLPRELSENHCSLLPGKDRLCVSVFLDVSEKGLLVGQPEIRRTIVRSSCQLTYPEAQKVIDSQDASQLQIPQIVKGNIRTLSALAQRRRKLRLRDASFDHWSNSDDGENFEAHELVEEMMLLANEEIAKFLSSSQQIQQRTPLRTQLPPKDHKLDDWVRQHGQFIKYSLFLRGFYSEENLRKMANKASVSEASERFKVQESVWSELCNAVETGDQAMLHKLICNESSHPQLAVTNSQFRRIQPKSQYVCKSDQPEENIVHFSLGMGCYTQFTSPIRRYIDIQVHRLVLDLIQHPGSNAKISSKDQIAEVCRRSTFAQDNSKKFEKASSKVHLAAKLKEKSHETTAVISLIDTDKEISLEILDREYNHLSTRQRKVKLSNLNPFDVELAPDGLEIIWRLRLYIAPEGNIIEEPKKEREKIALLLSQGMVRNRKVLNLPTDNWLKILKAFQEGDYEKLKTMIRQTERVRQLASRVPESIRPGKPHKSSEDEKAGTNLEHFYEKKLSLRKFDIANIQLTAHMTHGVFHPEIQLFKINPSVNICVEHRKYPRECFATTARYQASRKTYASVDKYIEAWEPVLAMEAATTAVEESDEFTMHHLKIKWKKDISGSLEGSFSLRNEYCSSRQMQFHAGDFVCVRVREDSYMKKTGSENNFASLEKTKTEGETNLLNEDQFSVTKSASLSSIGGKPRHESSCASESFWVGHCIINQDYSKELSDKVTLKVVTMDLHQSASDFPDELLNGADHLSTLTVIHRSLPHRRMFAVLRSLPSASQLAHSICMGHEPNQA
ncbi:helicase with zinc finger domain 2-like isoform X3 [Orbicella faveolata]|uniref:helicase with zinc finger domain 2-like isoform X3 n=1 Tax=Orbicella faveolata TaxID=48498 RepID=UPI0009E26E5F|nr:helicase with zinc finger domain 2-like isoform X3 [Orbicella faveolata]